MQNQPLNHVVCGGPTTYQTTRPRDVVRVPKGDHVPRSLVPFGFEVGTEATDHPQRQQEFKFPETMQEKRQRLLAGLRVKPSGRRKRR